MLAELGRRIEAGENEQSAAIQSLVARLTGIPPLADEYLGGGGDPEYLPDPGSDDALSPDEQAYENRQNVPETFGRIGHVNSDEMERQPYGGPVDGRRADGENHGRRWTRLKKASPAVRLGPRRSFWALVGFVVRIERWPTSHDRWEPWEPCCECSPTLRRTACCWMHETTNNDEHSCNPDRRWDSLLTDWSRQAKTSPEFAAAYKRRKAEAVSQLAVALSGERNAKGELVKIPEAIARTITAGRQAARGWPSDRSVYRSLVFAKLGDDEPPFDDGDWSSESKGESVRVSGNPRAYGCWDPACDYCRRVRRRADTASRASCGRYLDGTYCLVCKGPPPAPTAYSGFRWRFTMSAQYRWRGSAAPSASSSTPRPMAGPAGPHSWTASEPFGPSWNDAA